MEGGFHCPHLCCPHGHLECVWLLLLQHEPERQVRAPVQVANKKGSIALMFAAREGHVECVRLFLQHSHDAQLDVADSKGWWALALAAWGGQIDCLSVLLEHSLHLQMPDGSLWQAALRHRRVTPGPDVADSQRIMKHCEPL